MPAENIPQRLAGLSVQDEVGLRRLAAELGDAAEDAPAAIVREWARGTGESAGRAALVGQELEELALAALLEEAGRGPWPQRIELLRAAVDAVVRLRNLILLQLDALLWDTTAAAGTPPGDGRPLRVCDRACRLIARVQDILGRREPPLHSEQELMALPRDEQEREIEKWRKSNTRAAILIAARRFG